MMRINRKILIDLAGIGVVIAALVYLLFTLGLFELLTDRSRLFDLINKHRANAVFIFIGLQILQVVAAPIPGEVSGFVGGMFFGKVWGILFSTIGLTLGSWLAFNLARLMGRPLVEMAVSAETIRRYDYVMKHKGLFLSFLMFLIPGFPKDLLCYLLGLGHMSQRAFLMVSTSGRLLGTTLLTVGGSFFRDKQYGAFFTVAGIGIATVLFAMIYRERIERWFRLLRASQRIKSMTERRRLKKMSREQSREWPDSDRTEPKNMNRKAREDREE
ncbi:MAG: hypothetical protein A2Z46_03305 [Nitrospirae bacterium RBG_19FT_COMBO_55_12]|nr:MAG: hypothetical protein A2Z46_03305 [Nitrospirae bacterium RBG_19FT_COMBO_55_12]